MQLKNAYDVAIIGGGLAGLAAAIQLAAEGFDVILLEKEKYPFHKVCGEYVSMESWDFLQHLGLPLSDMQLPLIHTLQLTAPNGQAFSTRLPLGGFGISRFTLDHLLANIAVQKGVTLVEEARVDAVAQEVPFMISVTGKNFSKTLWAKVVCGAFGKRSNLDVKWKRDFIAQTNPRHNNYIGVKYHVQTDWPEQVIGLHNFEDGYCGISKVEGDQYCLCYLTTAANLKSSNYSIETLQQNVLWQNPALKKIFSKSHILEGFPVTIAQISFSKKTQVQNGLLMLGDAAGMITPLCGNGMSMALHSSKLAAGLITRYLHNELDQAPLQTLYRRQWQQHFGRRMAAGRLLQGFFGKRMLSNLFVQTFRTLPFLAATIIKKTHGRPF